MMGEVSAYGLEGAVGSDLHLCLFQALATFQAGSSCPFYSPGN